MTLTELIVALRAALLPRLPGLAIVQGEQPGGQGVPPGPSLIVWQASDTDYGWPERREAWNPETEVYDHVQRQVRETTLQVTCLVPGLKPGERMPAEWLALARAHLRSDPVLAALRAAGLSVLRVRDVRIVYTEGDDGRREGHPSFDVTVRHSDILTLTTPAATATSVIIERV